MNGPRFYYSSSWRHQDNHQFNALVREALRHFLPKAAVCEALEEDLKSERSLFMREGKNIYWIEISPLPFTRAEITDYLSRARRIQILFPAALSGVLVAPEFETGVRELLEFIRIPVRLFRCQEALPLEASLSPSLESILCLQEINPSAAPRAESFYPPLANEPPCSEPAVEEITISQHRLNREELKEFIQLELDVAGSARR